MSPKKFASACRTAFTARGNDTVERAVISCVNDCQSKLENDDIKIEGMSVTSMPDQTALVTVLASAFNSEQQKG